MNPLEIGCERAEGSFSASGRGATGQPPPQGSAAGAAGTGHRPPPGAAEPGPLFPLSQLPAAVPAGATGKGKRSGRIFPAVNPVLNKTSIWTQPGLPALPAPCPFLPETPRFLPPAPSGGFAADDLPGWRGTGSRRAPTFLPVSLAPASSRVYLGAFPGVGPFAAEMRKTSTPGCVKPRHFKATSLVISQILDFLYSPSSRLGSCILSLFQSRPWPAAWRRSTRGEPPPPREARLPAVGQRRRQGPQHLLPSALQARGRLGSGQRNKRTS